MKSSHQRNQSVSGYKHSEVGIIPVDWEVKQIRDMNPFVTSGSRGWATFYSDRGSPFIRITNLSRDCIYLDLEDLRFVNLVRNESEATRTQLQDGDVLISITADIGIIGYVSVNVPKPAYINQHIALVRFDPSQTDPKFVSYFLASDNPQKLFRALTDSGAKAGMNLTTVQQIYLALPPTLAEQHAIAEVLGDTDALIESLEQLIAKKRAVKQGVMQELLTGKTRLPGFSGEWGKTEFGSIAERIVGGGTPSRTVASYWNGVIPWMTVKDFVHHTGSETIEYITNDGLKNSASHLIPKHTLITSTRMALGKAVIFDVAVSINQDLKAIFATKDTDTHFLYYWFQLNERLIADMGSGSTVMGISLGELRKIPFIKPSLAEQTAIAAILSDMDEEIAALEAKLTKTRHVKQGMMQELLTGRIRLV